VLQCVAMCCKCVVVCVLLRVPSELCAQEECITQQPCVAVCFSVLQCVAILMIPELEYVCPIRVPLQHTATHCNTLQHTVTHCNTL